MVAAWAFTLLGLVGFSFGGLITNLPGAPVVSFKQYAGYFDVSKTRHMHYWFIESQNDPDSDPVLLWLTGGPGCSGLSAFLTEFGPFTVQAGGKTLAINPYSWNKKANILTLEAPVGVGFSYSDLNDIATNDDRTANENWEALKAFFTQFPQFRNNDFYITGESYGGIYVPTLADTILKKQTDFNINLKGLAIGNGCVSESLWIDTGMQYAYNHGMIDERSWQQIKDQCCGGALDGCAFSSFTSGLCGYFVQETMQNIQYSGINPYNIYSDCAGGDGTKKSVKFPSTRAKLDFLQRIKSVRSPRPSHNRKVAPCLDDSRETTYLNQPSVRKALFVPDSVPAWADCSDDVYSNYTQIYYEMDSRVKNAVSSGLRVLLYSGDIDIVCNFLMGQRFTSKLGYPQTSAKKTFHAEGQVGGFHTQYGKVEFATVRGAGHMAPADRPGATFRIIDAFLNGRQP